MLGAAWASLVYVTRFAAFALLLGLGAGWAGCVDAPQELSLDEAEERYGAGLDPDVTPSSFGGVVTITYDFSWKAQMEGRRQAAMGADVDAAVEGDPASVASRDLPTLVMEDILDGECVPYDQAWTFDLRPEGFPAVRDDGKQIVTVRVEASSGGEGEDAVMVVRWIDVDTQETSEMQVYDAGQVNRESEDAETSPCPKFRRQVRRKRNAVMKKIREHDWRPLTPLAVRVLGNPPDDPADTSPLPTPIDAKTLPAAERPLDLVMRDGGVFFRVRGVRLFGKLETSLIGPSSESCSGEGHVNRVLGDRATGVVAIEYDNEGPSCMCDVYDETEAFSMGEDFVAQAEARAAATDVVLEAE